MATPHLQRLSGLLCAVLQHFASTAQHWASEDGLRMINQLISFKSVALIIVMSPVPHSSLELQHTVSTVKVLEPIGPVKNHAGTRAFHLRQINHQLWKQQWLNLTFRGYQAPCLSSLWMVLERFVCNRSTFSLGDVHLIFMWHIDIGHVTFKFDQTARSCLLFPVCGIVTAKEENFQLLYEPCRPKVR